MEETIGIFIRRHRRLAHLTQKQMGEAIDMSDRIISMWETGQGVPGRDAINRMAQLFQIKADEFLRRMRADPANEEAQRVADEIAALADQEREQRKQQALSLVDQLLTDSQKLDRWIDFGEYLLKGRNENR